MISKSCEGLIGSNPLAALAAFGLFRMISEKDSGATMRWDRRRLFPVITSNEPDVRSFVVDYLNNQRGEPYVANHDSVDLTESEFKQAVSDGVGVEFYSAYCNDAVIKPAKKETNTSGDGAPPVRTLADAVLRPTLFRLPSKRVLLKTVKKGIDIILKDNGLIDEAIDGPWSYRTNVWSIGFDPVREQNTALMTTYSTKIKTWSVIGAVVLAFEALPLYPCLPGTSGLAVPAFSSFDDKVFFSWPLWDCDADIDTVRSLLCLGDLNIEKPDVQSVRGRGVFTMFRSERAVVDKYGTSSFREATRVV